VRDLIDILKNDLNEGVLPVSDIDGAKLYLEEISGKTMVDPALEKLGKKVEIKKPVEVLPTTRDEQYKLAGLCLSQDDKKQAFIWYQKSAEAGHIEAQYHLGCIFCLEESKIEDYFIPPEEDDYLDFIDNAIFWYEKAALAGHIEAQYQLGNLHCEYRYASNAIFWYEKAALAGHIEAQYQLGNLHCEYDYSDKADFWYQKAAEQGHVEALAELYEHRERESMIRELMILSKRFLGKRKLLNLAILKRNMR
jgi:TPR repeat protein